MGCVQMSVLGMTSGSDKMRGEEGRELDCGVGEDNLKRPCYANLTFELLYVFVQVCLTKKKIMSCFLFQSPMSE